MTDDIDQILISALMEDSRRSLKALAQISGLSSPSVAERLRRLEERGVLKGYTVEIDPKCFGYQLQAIVRVRPLPGQLQEVERQILSIPEFTECDKVTGRTASSPACTCARWNSSTPCSTASTRWPKPTPRSSRRHRSNAACRRWRECFLRVFGVD